MKGRLIIKKYIKNNINYMIKITGKYVAEELTKLIPGKEQFQVKMVAIEAEGLQNLIVEVPKDYVVKKDEDGLVELEVKASAKTWDNVSKRFNYVQVRFYVPKA